MPVPNIPITIAELLSAFSEGSLAPSDLVDAQLKRAVLDEGERVFLSLNSIDIKISASASDQRYRNASAGDLEGITVSIKDLFDVRGEVTAAGSLVLRSCSHATADSAAVSRLRSAGAVIFGRTNMVEFAYSGIGLNPHFGTPSNPWQRHVDPRVPGGSSSGTGVSVADAMVTVGLGSDTGGSIRVPAAFCGVVGFKPTASQVPLSGTVPMAPSLDSVGTIANSVDCCARFHAVLANKKFASGDTRSYGRPPRILKPKGVIWSELDLEVEVACERALDSLRVAGFDILEAELPGLDSFLRDGMRHYRQLTSFEAFAWHQQNVSCEGRGYDPRVWDRIAFGGSVSESEYAESVSFRRRWIDLMSRSLHGVDVLVTPTVACVAPRIADVVQDDTGYVAWSARIPRNVAWVNFLDGCALSLPCHHEGTAPVGLQVVGTRGADATVLAVGAAFEEILRRQRG